MPRNVDGQQGDHYEIAMNTLRMAGRESISRETRVAMTLEALTHAVLDVGIGLAEIQRLLREAAE